MVTDSFKKIVQEIKKNDQEFTISPRQLINAFDYEKRTSGNRKAVYRFLEENMLETEPDFMNVWIDGNIILRHKKKAKSKINNDPIQKIKILSAANNYPQTISREALLNEAVTTMMLNNFSQLPVVSGPRTVIGYISWNSIGVRLSNGVQSDKVIDYMDQDVTILDYETPLLDAISKVIRKEFALVQKDRMPCGIVTIADISEQFLTLTEPFLLLEQIENHVRQILDGKFLVEELRKFCKTGTEDRKIEHIDDLTFGDYIRLIEKPEHWNRLNLKVDRIQFVKHLDKVREIRNDIMHFNPEGISEDQRNHLTKMASFLMSLIKYKKE